MIANCERNPVDKIPIDFDPFNAFKVCGKSLTPIYEAPSAYNNSSAPVVTVKDALQGSLGGTYYRPEYRGQLDPVTELTQIGAHTTGFPRPVIL